MNKQFIVNEKVIYKNTDKTLQEGIIIEIHYDTLPELYYTIKLENGSIKQTINNRLKKIKKIK
jgi:hypothetical protein